MAGVAGGETTPPVNLLAPAAGRAHTRPVPDADDLRALARSSPWLFSTLRFTSRQARSDEPVRAWLRRPDRLRVEDAGGAVLGVVRASSGPVGAVLGGGPRDEHPPPPPPVRRRDGLVVGRPRGHDADDPMWQDYRWVAMLDPLELADGRDGGGGYTGPPLVVGTVREVEHGGRPAWEADVATTSAYEPRCGCCPLLRDPDSDRREWGTPFESMEYPTATRVRLDVGTGVCVLTEVLDGSYTGDGHAVLIEAVDEPMADALFVEPTRPPGDGWSASAAPSRWEDAAGGLEQWLANRGARRAKRARRPRPGPQ